MVKRYETFENGESQTIPNQSVSLREIVQSSLNGNSLGVTSQVRDVKYDDSDSDEYDPLNSLGCDLDTYQVMMTEQTRKATEAKRRWREKKKAEANEESEVKKESESRSKEKDAE